MEVTHEYDVVHSLYEFIILFPKDYELMFIPEA